MAWCDVVDPRTLRECRIALGQSQAAFAATLGASPESYRTWDAGRRAPPLKILARARALATHRDDHELLPLPVLALLIGVHVKTLRAAARDGRLPVTFDTRTTFRRLRARATSAAARAFRRSYYGRPVKPVDRRAPLTWASVLAHPPCAATMPYPQSLRSARYVIGAAQAPALVRRERRPAFRLACKSFPAPVDRVRTRDGHVHADPGAERVRCQSQDSPRAPPAGHAAAGYVPHGIPDGRSDSGFGSPAEAGLHRGMRVPRQTMATTRRGRQVLANVVHGGLPEPALRLPPWRSSARSASP